MPRPRPYKKFTDDAIRTAIEDVHGGMSLRKAALLHGLNRQTLANKLAGKHDQKPGRPCALSEPEEQHLAKRLVQMADWGFPCTSMDVRMIVKAYLDRNGIKHPQFNNNVPGWDWAQCFMRRNRLTKRMSGNISVSRAKVDASTIQEYCKHLETSLDGVTPDNLINYDETALGDDPGRKKVVVKRGMKYPESVKNHSKAGVSVMFAGSASGKLLPPYVVYKAQNLYQEWTAGGPAGAKYTFSPSGWFDEQSFEDWFFQVCLPYLRRRTGKKAIVGDNLSSHLSERVVKACKENNISFICLPPNSTHLTQPLDVAFFGPLKRQWRRIIDEWRSTPSGKKHTTLPKGMFPSMLKKLVETLNTENLVAGFRACGLSPVSAEPLLARLPRQADAVDTMDDHILQHLQDLRGHGSGVAGPSRTRRTKLNVVAGRAVGESSDEDDSSSSSDDEVTVAAPPGKRQRTGGRTAAVTAPDDEMTAASPPAKQQRIKQRLPPDLQAGDVADLNLHTGDFLVVRLPGRKKDHLFVGQIMETPEEDGQLQVSFMKEKGKGVFVFPDAEDAAVIDASAVVGKIANIVPDRRGSSWTLPFALDKIM